MGNGTGQSLSNPARSCHVLHMNCTRRLDSRRPDRAQNRGSPTSSRSPRRVFHSATKKHESFWWSVRTSRRTSPSPTGRGETWDVAEKAVTRRFNVVGAGRFERPTPCSQSRCATRLRYAPTER